jgi:hypothetical protein
MRTGFRWVSQKESRHKETPDAGEGNNTAMDLREMGYDNMDWINLPEDKGSCEHGNELLGSIKVWEILE